MGDVLRSGIREDAVMTTIVPPPKSPSVADQTSHTFRPEETNPELAAAAMVKEMMAKFPTPAIVNKKFSIFEGILMATNHVAPTLDKDGKILDPGNPTYFDCTPRLRAYKKVAETSVNVDGALFKNFWAYMMHPNYIIQGMPQMPTQEEKPGLISGLLNKFRGQPQENKTP
jgi:hypothetical protein